MSPPRLALAIVVASAISFAFWLSSNSSSADRDAISPDQPTAHEERGAIEGRESQLAPSRRQTGQGQALEAAKADSEQVIAVLANYPTHDRWDLTSPVLPGRDGFDSEALSFQIDRDALTAEEREAVLRLCESWNGLMAEERNVILGRRGSFARSNIEAGIDCALAGTADADRIHAEAQGPNAVSFEVLVGQGIAFDGGTGRYVVILRRGFDSEAESAQARLDELYRASIRDLDALLVRYDAKLHPSAAHSGPADLLSK